MKKNIIIISLIFLSCHPKYPLFLGSNFELNYNSRGYTSLYYKKNSIVLYGDVKKYAFDKNFIIIEINPLELLDDEIEKKGISNYNKKKEYIDNSAIREYWIINKSEKSEFDSKRKKYINLYGPFDIKHFSKKRIELKISKKLTFLTL